MSEHPVTVCVLGMHRSGSSLAAQVLAGNGLDTGRSQIGRSRFNREGHLEDRFVVGINKRLLLHFGGTWDRPPRLPAGWLDDPRVARLRRRAERYAVRQTRGGRPYFFKDPRTSLVFPFWRQVFGADLRCLVVLREPEAVVASLLRRHQEWMAPGRSWWRAARSVYHRLQGALEPLAPLTAPQAENLWHHYYESIVRDLGSHPRSVLVYERLLAEPRAEVRRVLSELGLPADDAVTTMVKPGLRHWTAEAAAPAVADVERRLSLHPAGGR